MSDSNALTSTHAQGSVQAHPLGQAFSERSDLVPLYLLRFDRANTRRAYLRDLATFFGSDVITLEMARRATFTDVNRFIASQEDGGMTVATVRRRVTALRGFFAWLVALGQLSLNPADRQLVRRLARDSGKDRVVTVLTAEQASDLLGAVDLERPTGLRDYTFMLTLLNCVLRRSEAASMNVESLVQVGGHWLVQLDRAKGGANQSVKMPGHVAIQVLEYIQSMGYASGPLWRSFSRNESSGRRLSGASVYAIVNKHAKAAGITRVVGAHTLRHTGCTLAIEHGATVQQVQTHARHKSIETTMLYVHQRDRLAHSAADLIGVGRPKPAPDAE